MDTDDLKKAANETLEKMACTDVQFPVASEAEVIVTFNCKEITSFVTEIPGWTYSGIRLDTSGEREYRIDFKKIM